MKFEVCGLSFFSIANTELCAPLLSGILRLVEVICSATDKNVIMLLLYIFKEVNIQLATYFYICTWIIYIGTSEN